MRPEVRRVALRQLLTMTAGLPDQLTGPPWSFAHDPDWIGSILATPLERPGTFRYANAGAHLLVAILARATGTTRDGTPQEEVHGSAVVSLTRHAAKLS